MALFVTGRVVILAYEIYDLLSCLSSSVVGQGTQPGTDPIMAISNETLSRSIHTHLETKDKEDHAKGLHIVLTPTSRSPTRDRGRAGNWRQTFFLKEYHLLAENGRRFKGPMTIA